MDRYETIRSDYEVMLQRSVQNAGCDLQKDMILPDTYGDMKKILATTVKLSPHADSIESDGVS